MKSKPENPKLKTTDVTVFLGTWNVNGISPPQSLGDWLGAGFANSDSGYPDIYCVGFQELDMSANALLLGNEAKVRPWEDAVFKTINSYETYELVKMSYIFIYTCIYFNIIKGSFKKSRWYFPLCVREVLFQWPDFRDEKRYHTLGIARCHGKQRWCRH